MRSQYQTTSRGKPEQENRNQTYKYQKKRELQERLGFDSEHNRWVLRRERKLPVLHFKRSILTAVKRTGCRETKA